MWNTNIIIIIIIIIIPHVRSTQSTRLILLDFVILVAFGEKKTATLII